MDLAEDIEMGVLSVRRRSHDTIACPSCGIWLAGRQQEIHAERDRKLEAARKQRQIRRKQAA